MDHKQLLIDLLELDSNDLKKVTDFINELKGNTKTVMVSDKNFPRPMITNNIGLEFDMELCRIESPYRKTLKRDKSFSVSGLKNPDGGIWLIVTEDDIVYTGGGSYEDVILKVQSGSVSPMNQKAFEEEIKGKEIFC